MNEIDRGHRAANLLDDDILKESLETMEALYMSRLRHGKTLEERETAHKYLEVMDRFKGHLRSLIATGEMSAKQIEEFEGRKKFWRMG